MVKKTQRWKNYHTAKWVTNVIHFIITIVPILVIFIAGVCDGQLGIKSKFCLGICAITALVLAIVEVCKHLKFRTVFWLIMLALCICVNNVFVYVCIFLGCSALDELVVLPLNKYFTKKFDKIDTARETAQYIQEA